MIRIYDLFILYLVDKPNVILTGKYFGDGAEGAAIQRRKSKAARKISA